MPKPEPISETRSELKQTFLRYLPDRVEAIEEGWLATSGRGWSIAKLPPLLQRVQDLTGFARKFGFAKIYDCLLPLAQCFQTLLELKQAPSALQTEQIDNLILRLKTTSQEDGQVLADSTLMVGEQWPQVFYFNSSTIIAPGLIGALDELRYSLVHFTKFSEMEATFKTSQPAALIAEADTLSQITGMVRDAAQIGTSLPLVVLSASNSLETRLLALRIGAKALFPLPTEPQVIADRIHRLVAPSPEPAYRVLVMDDDPPQADFAAAILRKGGFAICAVTDPGLLLETMEEFRPDLVLMDLYMPGVDGLELTKIIRTQTAFTSLPIIFMSGEQDIDKHLDAMIAGGDDFLTKPIRPPRRLLTIVKSRILRARAGLQSTIIKGDYDPTTGLLNRYRLLQYLNNNLATGSRSLAHGFICLEIDNWESICSAMGARSYETLVAMLGARFITQLMPQDWCARIDKNRFAVLASRPQKQELTQLGSDLIQLVSQRRVVVDGANALPILSAGLYLFQPAPENASALEQRAIAVCSQARNEGGNRLAIYQAETVKEAKPQPAQPDAIEIIEQVRLALRNNQLQIMFRAFTNLRNQQQELQEIHWRLVIPNGGQRLSVEILMLAKQAIGLSRDIDRWLIGRTLDTLREHRQAGRQTWLLIHQTVETLADPQFAPWLRDELRRRLLVGTGLILEFNLADIATDVKGTRALIGDLDVMGVEVCLSRLSHNEASQKILKYLRTPYIKVSEKLLTTDNNSIATILELARESNSKLIIPMIKDPRIISRGWLDGANFVQANAS